MAIQDVDIILKAKVDIPIAGMASVSLDDVNNPTIVFKSGGGKIQILDWQTDFASTIVRNFVHADINVKIGGQWYDYSSLVPDITRDSSGLLQTALWLLNISDPIEKILVSIY